MSPSKRHITTNAGQPLTTSDGSYVVIGAEIDPQDLSLSTRTTPLFQLSSKRFTRRGSVNNSGFTSPIPLSTLVLD